MNENQIRIQKALFGDVQDTSVDPSPEEEFLLRWLQGTDCSSPSNKSIFYVHEDKNYLILKHQGHTSYCDRIVGSSYCPTYYCLYDIRKDKPDRFGDPCLKKWEGRWKKSYYEEIDEIINKVRI